MLEAVRAIITRGKACTTFVYKNDCDILHSYFTNYIMIWNICKNVHFKRICTYRDIQNLNMISSKENSSLLLTSTFKSSIGFDSIRWNYVDEPISYIEHKLFNDHLLCLPCLVLFLLTRWLREPGDPCVNPMRIWESQKQRVTE